MHLGPGRGMVSEDNLVLLREGQARHIVGTPKQQLRCFEAQLLEQQHQRFTRKLQKSTTLRFLKLTNLG
jgi:hypothetical protein